MNILALESSCDETSAAVVKDGVEVLSNIVYSQIETHAKTGGVVPEVAAREHVVKVVDVVEQALAQAKTTQKDIDAIAVTTGPGLITSLLVGVDTAKTLAYAWDKPLIAVNHLDGHIAAANVKKIHTPDGEVLKFDAKAKFPRLLLLVSGGHTQLFLETSPDERKLLGQTVDDAAGEALDKAAAVLGLPYPGGVSISQEAAKGNEHAFDLPRPMHDSGDYQFSFSGLKTAFIDVVRNLGEAGRAKPGVVQDLSASFQLAVFDSLALKVARACEEFGAKQVVLAGGVAASVRLREDLTKAIEPHGATLLVPDRSLCTDNAAMIGAEAFFYAKTKTFVDTKTLEASVSFPLRSR